jgi:hypothetical protein
MLKFPPFSLYHHLPFLASVFHLPFTPLFNTPSSSNSSYPLGTPQERSEREMDNMDFATAALQNRFSTYELFLPKENLFYKKMENTLDLSLLYSFIIEH